MKPFEFCVFIGRFQPFHNGHYELFKEALNKANTVLIVIGSYNKASDIENPWSAAQREEMIRAALTDDAAFKRHVHANVATYLENFKNTDSFKSLKASFDYLRDYKTAWEGAPFPVTFVTVDCVVIKSGHVLVVRRKGNPGKGQIALPGGFLNQNEHIQDGALRELKEETGIKVDKDILEASI